MAEPSRTLLTTIRIIDTLHRSHRHRSSAWLSMPLVAARRLRGVRALPVQRADDLVVRRDLHALRQRCSCSAPPTRCTRARISAPTSSGRTSPPRTQGPDRLRSPISCSSSRASSSCCSSSAGTRPTTPFRSTKPPTRRRGGRCCGRSRPSCRIACVLLLIQGVSELLKSLYMARTGIELEHKEKVEV